MISTVASEKNENLLLENMVTRGWYYLFRFRACLAQEKQELDKFLDQYYAQLGGWLQQAAASRRAVDTSEGGETLALSDHLHLLQKSIYRDVLKLCHPDVAAELVRPYAAEWLRQVMQAYADGNGQKLVQIRLELQRMSYSDAAYEAALKSQYQMLQQEVSHAREAVRSLRSSAAYRLQQRILQARQAGFDLLSHIVQQLRNADFVTA